ncbi:TetR/AcrR family transcriptional regulator [Streptomyces monticola]|uniref:TetR/AcrR family transcriptional regulator n=1 Tax=Streptomyces monticola TaxID=2666263 RepID=A0ABW2JWX3_9ACTN
MGTETTAPPKGTITDKRLMRGARSRKVVLERAVDVASLEGLDNISFGGLAADTGLSKAGIQALFKTKEALQLATVEFARELFIDAVIRPARPVPRGAARLRALVENFITYIHKPLLPGGCFRVANLADFDSRPGPIRDALFSDQRKWFDILAAELRKAVEAEEIEPLDIELAVFQIDSVLCAANTALRGGDTDALDKVRRTVENLLKSP